MFQERPASISPAEFSTRFPAPENFPTDENGIVQKDCRGFTSVLVYVPLNLWGPVATCRYMMARDVAWPLLEAASRAKPTTYSETLALDLVLRNADIPSKYYPTAGEQEFPTPGRRLKEWTLTCFRPLCKNSTARVTFVLNEWNS